jgi:hypothetical protein
MTEQNRFGGGNANSLYVPLSDMEQEVLMRLVESQTLRIKLYGWGMDEVIPKRVSYGDKRVQVLFTLSFKGPAVPVRVGALDLELRTADGISLLRKPYPTVGGDGQPIQICSGMTFDLAWDIAIDHMDPNLVKRIKPGALGLTSRRLDKETGERTLAGNMHLGESDREALRDLDAVEASVRALDPVKR